MKRTLAFTAAAALAALTATPALAAPWHQHQRGHVQGYVHAEPYRPIHRNVADPSFGNRAGINYARQTGRCVADLGYGRFEYCGW